MTSLEIQRFSQYRGDVFVYTLSGIVLPMVLMNVWITIAESRPGFDKEYLIQYYYIQIFINILISAWHAGYFADNVNKGALSAELLRPYDYILHIITNNIGEKVWKIFFTILALVVLGIMYYPYLHIPIFKTFFVSVVVLFFASIMKFLIQHIIGLLGFWTTSVRAIEDYNDMLYSLVSGKLFPLQYAAKIIPLGIIDFLPYPYMMSFPINVILGKATFQSFVQGLEIQLIWIAVLFVSYRILWHKGLKIYGGYGT